MATTKQRPKKKPKLRGGTNQPAAEPIPADDGPKLSDTLRDEWAEEDRNAGVLPLPAETNGHVGNLADAVDLVIEKAEEHAPVNRLTEALAYDSPERLAEWDRLTVLVLNQSANECAEYRTQYEDKAEAAKEAKKKFDLAVADHFKLLAERRAGRGKPIQQELFDKTEGHAAAQPDLREPGEVPPVEDESWKLVPLSELVEKDGLPQKVAELLAEADHKDRGRLAPIVTMGDLTRYTEPEESGYQKRLNDLKGIGPAKVDAIGDATMKFWARWKPHASTAADAGSGGSPGDAGTGGQPADDRGAGGDPAAQAEPEPAPESNAEPAGYHTEGTERIAKRKRKAK